MLSSLTLIEHWQRIREALREKVSPQSFDTWLKHVEPVSYADGLLTLGAANLFVKSWIERHYLEPIACVCEKVLGEVPTVKITISAERFQAMRAHQADAGLPPVAVCDGTEGQNDAAAGAVALADAPRDGNGAAAAAGGAANPGTGDGRGERSRRSGREPRLPVEHTLESFVTGPSSRLVHAACLRAISHPGDYNPIFIHGGHGLGKTHLLHGICRAMMTAQPAVRAEFYTGHEFVNDYIRAVTGGRVEAWRRRLQGCGLLVIDDIQVLGQGNKRSTQEELLHLLDALLHAGSQIVLAADQSAEALKGISEKLTGRFQGGLTVALHAPDDQARRAIIREKAAQRDLVLSDAVVDLVAERHRTNVRELIGAVGKLTALATLEGRSVDLRTAEMLLGVKAPEAEPELDLGAIAQIVAAEFGLSVADLKSRKRARAVGVARKLAILLARRLTHASLEEIGRFFGGRHHSTIIANLRRPLEPLGDKERFRHRLELMLGRLRVQLRPEDLFTSQGSLFE